MNKILWCGVVLITLTAATAGCSPEPLTVSPTHVAFALPTLIPTTPVPPTAAARPLPSTTLLPSPPPPVLPTATFTAVPPTPILATVAPRLPSAPTEAVAPTVAPTSTQALPTTAPSPTVPPSPAASSTPPVPPGLYVTDLKIDPAPVRGQELRFTAKFLNSMDHEQSQVWLVYVFRADNQRGTGETTRTNSALLVGTTEYLSNGYWKLPLGGPCDYFYAQVGWINDENKVIWFTTPTGTVFQKGLAVCPP